jgi:hypothetical protein
LSWRLPKPGPRAKTPPLSPLRPAELDAFVAAELAARPATRAATIRRKLREAGRSCDGKALRDLLAY